MKQVTEVDLDPMTVRLLAFVKRKDGPSEVARRIGTKPAMFYNFEAGRSKPSSDTLRILAQHYEDFDPMYILTGREQAPAPLVRPDVKSEVLAAENAALKQAIERLEQTVAFLQNVVSAQLGKEFESKSESANGATQGDQLALGLSWMQNHCRSTPVSLDVRDARQMSRTWDNPAPLNPPRR